MENEEEEKDALVEAPEIEATIHDATKKRRRSDFEGGLEEGAENSAEVAAVEESPEKDQSEPIV